MQDHHCDARIVNEQPDVVLVQPRSEGCPCLWVGDIDTALYAHAQRLQGRGYLPAHGDHRHIT